MAVVDPVWAGDPSPKARIAANAPRTSGPDFLNDVMPLISRLGCNAVACHGAKKGRGGFNLSMFGADPQSDYEALTKTDGGRRVNKVEPLESLFLLKATGSIPHGGKQPLVLGSRQYGVLAAWVARGAPLSHALAPKLVSLELRPPERILETGQTQQLAATAVFSDGSRKDVTGLARFESSDRSVSSVDENGKVQANGYGQAAIVVSYLRQAAVVRILAPQPLGAPFPRLAANNKVDELVYAKWKALGIPPAPLSTDQEFLRRVYLDVTGTLPRAAEARAYLADRDPQKRRKLIDRLLDSEEFADYWAMKWGDLFRMKSEFPNTLWPNAVQAYHRWVRVSIAHNKPYDQFARELLTATGSNFRAPPANFFRAFLKKDPQNVAEAAALTFMGVRIGCARCHGHPTENWTSEDNLGLAAFFAQLKYKSTMEWKEEIVYIDAKQALRHPRTSEIVKPKFLGGQPLELNAGEDARAKFAAWLTSPDNPWFARNMVNRIWFWLLGRGIVHEPDDLRPTNPPENPQLLDYLAGELVGHKYALKHVYRLVLNSRTYQLSAQTSRWNRNDVAHFSHYYVKRLGAETLLDAVSAVTGKWDTYASIIPEPFVILPPAFRATHLADGSVGLPFLELFGRPPRDTAFESERDLQLYLRQTLHLLNSSDVQNKLSASPRLAQLVKDLPDDSRIVDELYLATLSRFPTEQERAKMIEYASSAGRVSADRAPAGQQAAAAALAKVRRQRAKANADVEAAARALKQAEAAIAEAEDADARADAVQAAAVKRKQAVAARANRDRLPAAEKAALARLAEANKRLDAAKAAAKLRKNQALQDVLWALLNTKEFVFNH
jgi:hypothetical protein